MPLVLRVRALPLLVLLAAACAPPPATPSAQDLAGTVEAAAFNLLTQTAAAASPTSSPTGTATPLPPSTPTANVTSTPAHQRPAVKSFAGCWFGPGPKYILESNISPGKRVELLGVGSEPGWYIIRNPYFHRPCWMEAANLEIDSGVNLAVLPVMTPGVPLMGQ